MSYDQTARDYSPKDPYERGIREDYMRNAYTGPQVTQRSEGNVARELRLLEQNIAALTNSIDSLSDKLAPLRFPMPEQKQSGTLTGSSASSIANHMSIMNDTLLAQVARLQQLNQEVDL